MSVFETLSAINVNEHTEKKGKFTYLSWAWAWGTLKKQFPEATFEKHQFQKDGNWIPYMIDDQGYAFVKVSVAVQEVTLTETFPVLNHQNKPIQNPNAFDINTALQRCLAKAIAMHGLGFYIYAGEDIPESEKPEDDLSTLNDNQVQVLEALIEAVGANRQAFMKYIKVDSLDQILAKNYEAVVKLLEQKRKKA